MKSLPVAKDIGIDTKRFGLAAFAPFGGQYQRTVFAIWGEDTLETGEVDSWPG